MAVLANGFVDHSLVNATRLRLPSGFLSLALPFGFHPPVQLLLEKFAIALGKPIDHLQNAFNSRPTHGDVSSDTYS